MIKKINYLFSICHKPETSFLEKAVYSWAPYRVFRNIFLLLLQAQRKALLLCFLLL